LIWAIEATTVQPTRHSLVDGFRYAGTRYPPFPSSYSGFKLKILGRESLLSGPIRPAMDSGLQRVVHRRFLTQQRFFVSLRRKLTILSGLIAAAGVRL
jgi:hypothetical protein